MKKIGIITSYYQNMNYGGQLQAYALQKTLSDAGIRAYEISLVRNRRNIVIRHLIKMSPKRLLYRYWQKRKYERLCQSCKIGVQLKRRKDLFDKFEQEIPHTKEVRIIDLANIVKDFNAIIVGSDNVWNPEGYFDSAVFLDFATDSQYKMSYAASIGVKTLTSRENVRFRQGLKKFDSISVREVSSINLLKPLLEKKAVCVVDPTFLFKKEQWSNIENKVEVNEKYIFEYFVDDNIELKKIIHQYAQKCGIKVVGIPHTQKRYNYSDTKYIDIPIYECGPREWVYLIHHAEMIFSDSFHGTVFSIIFKKKFWSILKNKKDIPAGDIRISDLLKVLCLSYRILDVNKKFNFDSFIDYSKTDILLNEWILKSKQFLKENLHEIESR